MRILAASFRNKSSAASALKTLDKRYPGGGLELASLGTSYDRRGPSTVIAGRFAQHVVAAVRTAITEMGGRVVIDVDETTAGR